MPKKFVSDHEAVVERLSLGHLFAEAHSSSTNGTVERMNREMEMTSRVVLNERRGPVHE